MEFFNNSVFFGVMLSLLAYGIGALLKQRFKLAIFNPLLIAVIIVIAVLTVSGIDYKVYNEGAKYISYLLTPATICLAIPLYEQFELLKSNWNVESAFGSQPICITVKPFSASAAATLDTVVDLPMPPLPYIAILIMFFLHVCDDIGISGLRGYAFQSANLAGKSTDDIL